MAAADEPQVNSRQPDVAVRRAAADGEAEAARRESAARWAAQVAEKDALLEMEPTALVREGPAGLERRVLQQQGLEQGLEALQQEQQWVLPEEHSGRMA
jgi:hypothetical protein